MSRLSRQPRRSPRRPRRPRQPRMEERRLRKRTAPMTSPATSLTSPRDSRPLGFGRRSSRRSRRSATRSPRPSNARRSRPCSKGATCSARPRRERARRRRSRCRCSSASRGDVRCGPHSRDSRRSCSFPRASSRCRSRRRCTATDRSYGARVLPVYGGQAIGHAAQGAARGRRRHRRHPWPRRSTICGAARIRLDSVRFVVLDEADEMLDMGFAEDLEAILEALPEERQTALFSATMAAADRRDRRATPARPGADRDRSPKRFARTSSAASGRSRTSSSARHKAVALGRVLDMENPTSAIVFCRTRTEVDELTETLGGARV